MAITKQEKERVLRELLFVPCDTKEALHTWIKAYLSLDIPDAIVDESSNSSPMDMIWEIYDKARKNNDPRFSRALYFAARDSFKCREKGTLVLTRTGLKKIEDIVVGEEVWSGWNWRKVTHWIHDGEKEAVEVELSNGVAVVGSPIHRVWAWEPGRLPDWKKISELNDNDLVCIDINSGFNDFEINQEEYDLGYICGILQGDGGLTLLDEYNCAVLTTEDDHVKAKWFEFCLNVAGREPKCYTTNKYGKKIDFSIRSKPLAAFLKSLGLSASYSWQKEVPDYCLKTQSAMVGFISGILDTDGSCSKGGLSLQITAKKLIEQLQVMLISFGIEPKVRYGKKLYSGQRHLVHTLIINQNDLLLLKKIGVKLSAKKAGSVAEPKTSDAHDSIPRANLSLLLERLPNKPLKKKGFKTLKPKISSKYPSITREKLKNLMTWAAEHKYLSEVDVDFWNNIVKNKWIKVKNLQHRTADFYDLTVEGDHSYWAGGTINHNTLAFSIIELLALFHLKVDVVHLAAIESQSYKAQLYLKNYLNKPILREFKDKDNKRNTGIYYFSDGSTFLSEKEFTQLSISEQKRFNRESFSVQVAVLSLKGANSSHSPLVFTDELDVVTDRVAYEESKMIPAPLNGQMPISILTSSRKFSFGLVQDEIDNAHKTGLKVRHWNLIDVTEPCKPNRHRPDLPKLPVYSNSDELVVLDEDGWKDLPPASQAKFEKVEAFNGCVKNFQDENGKWRPCQLFPMCKQRLATHQTSKSKLLKPIEHSINQFKNVSLNAAKAQLLCLKPSAEGLIYSQFDREKHMLTPAQMAEKITGIKYSPYLTKRELIAIMKERGCQFYGGFDYGFTHYFATVVLAVDGNKGYIVESFAERSLDPGQKIKYCDERIKHYDADIYADPEDPSTTAMFARMGYRMKKWNKYDNSVRAGIEIVRLKLKPTIGEPELFLLKDDFGCEELAKAFGRYHWEISEDGQLKNRPDKKDDDHMDACRYAIMNAFAPGGKLVAPGGDTGMKQPGVYNPNDENWFKNLIQEKIQEAGGTYGSADDNEVLVENTGGIIWSIK